MLIQKILGSKCDFVAFQGLNYVAALLLLVMTEEEDAFWMLSVLLENVLVSDCYTDNLSGCHVEQRVFKDLLTKKCPRFALFTFDEKNESTKHTIFKLLHVYVGQHLFVIFLILFHLFASLFIYSRN